MKSHENWHCFHWFEGSTTRPPKCCWSLCLSLSSSRIVFLVEELLLSYQSCLILKYGRKSCCQLYKLNQEYLEKHGWKHWATLFSSHLFTSPKENDTRQRRSCKLKTGIWAEAKMIYKDVTWTGKYCHVHISGISIGKQRLCSTLEACQNVDICWTDMYHCFIFEFYVSGSHS